MNILIQTNEDELICFYTSSIERAKEVCNEAGIKYMDVYEVADDQLQYYCIDDRVWDVELSS